MKKQPIIAYVLLAWWIILSIWSYIGAFDTTVWRAEMIPVVCVVALIVFLWYRTPFSSLSYIFMGIFIYLHTVGAHYTFERVPFDRFTDFFGFERNHFDRIAHFSVGFYAYAIIEYCNKNNLTKSTSVSVFVAIATIFAVAWIYEIIEWLFAISNDPDAGTAFLGSQWDIRDAQKDMLADGLW